MEKYRITTTTNDKLLNVSYHIQRKRWYGWRDIKIKENNNSVTLSFTTYEQAEQRMVENYFRDGYVFKPYPNEYHYTSHTYYY